MVFKEEVSNSNDRLDEQLELNGYAQNIDKQEVTPCLRSKSENKQCIKIL